MTRDGRLARGVGAVAVLAAALSSAAIAGLPIRQGVVAVLGLAAVLGVVLGDGWLMMYIAAQPLQGISLLGVQAFGFRLSHVFFLVVLFLLLWGVLVRRHPLPRTGLLDALVVVFGAYVLLSITWSPAPLSSSLVTGGKLAFDLAVFVGLSALVQREPVRTLRIVAWGFGIAFVYMAGLSAYNLFQMGFRGLIATILIEQSLSTSESVKGLSLALSTFTGWAGRNIIAGWMALGVMIVWGSLSGRWRQVGLFERVAWFVAFAAAAGYILLSLSRGTWLSLAVAAPVLWWRAGHRISGRWVAWLVVGGLVVATVVVTTGLWDVVVARVGVASAAVDPAVSTRLETWQAVLATFARHPIIGVGLKGTEVLSRAVDPNAANPHNVYIQILGELGLIGAVLFAAMVGHLLWRLWRAGDSLPAPLNRLAWGLFGAMTCYLAQSLTQAEFMDLGVWTVMGLAAGLIQVSPTTAEHAGT